MTFDKLCKLVLENKTINWNGILPQKLYHATFGAYIPSIEQTGLVLCSGNQNFDWCDKVIYLADNPNLAESFVEVAENENIPEEYFDDIVIIEIDTHHLDINSLFDDPNSNIDGEDEQTRSFIYTKDIPAKFLNILNY